MKTEQRPMKPSGEKQGSREKILDVATDLFVEHGYAGTPLSAIAAQLDFTKAALYYHFKSKVDILSGILSPLLDAIDELLERAPERFPDAQQRWEFLYTYSQVLLSHSRAVEVLAINSSNTWLPDEIKERIEYHRRRTMELAMLPDMSDEDQVKAILIMDMLHREIVFTDDRMVVPGMTPERRREIVYAFIHEALDATSSAH
ncbi:TetR/AcrR family transcriptional regulator [Glutamicibacter soli]